MKLTGCGFYFNLYELYYSKYCSVMNEHIDAMATAKIYWPIARAITFDLTGSRDSIEMELQGIWP